MHLPPHQKESPIGGPLTRNCLIRMWTSGKVDNEVTEVTFLSYILLKLPELLPTYSLRPLHTLLLIRQFCVKGPPIRDSFWWGGRCKNLPAISSSMKRAKNSTLTFARVATLIPSRVLFLARFIDEEIGGRFSHLRPRQKESLIGGPLTQNCLIRVGEM